jgi:hypothetical protein
MTDIIRQEFLHVQVNGTESDALTLEKTLPGLCRNGLTPAIERAMEHGAPPTGHLCIDRLEIDAGTVDLDKLEHDLSEAVAQKLEKVLRAQTSPEEMRLSPVAGKFHHKTEQRCITEAFVHFLTTGSLPWSFRLPKESSLEQVMLTSWQEQKSLGNLPDTARDAVLRALASSTARARLARQFSPLFRETLLSLVSPEASQIMGRIKQALSGSTVPTTTEGKCLERQLWETMFAEVASGRIPRSRYLVSRTWAALPDTAKENAELQRVLEVSWRDVTGNGRPAVCVAGMATKMNAVAAENAGEFSSAEWFPGGHPDIEEGGVYIENAGVILLHPFLPQLFGTLGIAAEDKMLQPERALGLLHFLTTGQVIAPEYELMLPKILCNVPLETPVDSEVTLTAGEQEEAVALLEAVVGHWAALRNTSPDALRGTFLLRPGKISLRDGDWLLQVESNSVDLLLELLPWGISPIKLPWMEKMLWVEWR